MPPAGGVDRGLVGLERRHDADGEDHRDHAEAGPGGEVVPLRDQHLDADEAQDHAEAHVQVAELARHSGQEEIERAGRPRMANAFEREHDEGLAADGQDGRYRVDGGKHTSVVSMRISTANSGVARRLALCRVKSFWPSYSLLIGMKRRTILSAGLFSGWTSASSWRAMRTAVMMRNRPKM